MTCKEIKEWADHIVSKVFHGHHKKWEFEGKVTFAPPAHTDITIESRPVNLSLPYMEGLKPGDRLKITVENI